MELQDLRDYCLNKKGVTEDFPFDDTTLTLRVGGKIFLFAGIDQGYPYRFTVKCDPDLAMRLRDTFTDIVPGYHTSKRHWNTVSVNGSIDDDKLKWMIDHSYELVFDGLPKTKKESIESERKR
ncbi:MAG: MmcQ/YjbR family DNA-binding protein [Spirochaetales bacterium]|nr:MmcQ/YjbR family DNA-binding protein [Spirochaetales bacterium]